MADAWTRGDAYEDYVGRWSRRLAPRFLDWAGAAAGSRALDVGCGTGALSEALLARGAAVEGLDPSEAFVAAARARLPRGAFRVGDAQALPFPDGAFDAAVSGLVLNFVPDPARAAREMARVTRPGGVVAAYVWDYAGDMQLMRRFWDAAVALDPGARDLDEGRRFPLCRPEPLAGLFEGAGLRGVATAALDQPAVFRDFDDYWQPFLGGTGPAPQYCAGLPGDRREALRERLRATLPAGPDGSIALVARAWAVRGEVPAAAQSL